MILYFLGTVVLVSVIAGIVAAQVAAQLPFFDMIGTFSAGLFGLALCFALAYAMFFVLDPDPVSEFDAPVPLYLRTLPITTFAGFLWLPIFVVLFNRLRRIRVTS